MTDEVISGEHDTPLAPADLLKECVRALVDAPREVRIVTLAESGTSGSLFLIHVAPGDRGKVIGKQGATITALRTLFGRVAASLGLGTLNIEVADSKTQRERL